MKNQLLLGGVAFFCVLCGFCFGIGLVAYAPSLERLETKHWWVLVAVLVALAGFVYVIFWTGGYIGNLYGPELRELEISSSP